MSDRKLKKTSQITCLMVKFSTHVKSKHVMNGLVCFCHLLIMQQKQQIDIVLFENLNIMDKTYFIKDFN